MDTLRGRNVETVRGREIARSLGGEPQPRTWLDRLLGRTRFVPVEYVDLAPTPTRLRDHIVTDADRRIVTPKHDEGECLLCTMVRNASRPRPGPDSALFGSATMVYAPGAKSRTPVAVKFNGRPGVLDWSTPIHDDLEAERG